MTSRDDLYPRADGRAITFRAHEFDIDPKVAAVAVVAEKGRHLIHVVDKYVHVPVVVEISEGTPAAGVVGGDPGPQHAADILEAAIA